MSDPIPSSSDCLGSDCVSDINRPESFYEEFTTHNDEFRLLQIDPAESSTTEIIARLFKTSLDDAPPYEAVSYRWEHTNHSHYITVNGVKFPVMKNVFLLLSEFRRQSFPSSPTFWIDSICIDQSSVSDRNYQVQLMGKIYSRSSLVRIWIGIESDLAEQAFDLVRQCGPAEQISGELVAAKVLHNKSGTKALTDLLQRDYWNRMWVFQEIVLAREAIVHCGKLHAPWSNFKWLDKVSSKHVLWLTAQIENPWILDFRKALFNIAHFCVSSIEARHTNNVLHPTRHLLCNDPRDKLYALRGVCKALAGMLKVDYSVPIRDVFTAFTRKQIIEDGNLSALLTAGLWNPLNGEDIGLPSWVPDLRGMSGVDIRYLAGNHINSFDADGGAFSQQKDYLPKWDSCFVSNESDILNVHAILCDLIQSNKPLQGISRSAKDRRDLIQSFCTLPDTGKLSMERLRQLFEGLIFGDRTTLVKHLSTERGIQERARRLVFGFYKDLDQLFGPDPVFIRFLHSFKCSPPDSEAHVSLQEDILLCDSDMLRLNQMEFLRRASETTDRQVASLFLTFQGRLGIGPRNVQQDDIVGILRGCRVPLLLRQCNAYYRVVGPAYISGMMQGEAVRFDERGDHTNFQMIQLV